MNQTHIILLSLVALIGCVFGCNPAPDDTDSVEPNLLESAVTSGKLTFEVNHPIPEGTESFKVWLPYVSPNDYQNIENIEMSGNYTSSQVYYEVKDGNVILFAQWNDPTVEVARLTYSLDIEREEMIKNDFPYFEGTMPIFADRYLVPTSLGPLDGEVETAALELTDGLVGSLEKARAIYDFIVVHSVRDPEVTGCGVGDVVSLLDSLSGKCVDLSSVFVALARSAGIPSREIFGTRISKEGDITGNYHCRGEFYLPGYGWVPVDPSDVRKLMLSENLTLEDPLVQEAIEYYFGRQTETYVDFGTGRDIVLNPLQAGEPLNYFMYPHGELDGIPLDYLNVYSNSLSVEFVSMQ